MKPGLKHHYITTIGLCRLVHVLRLPCLAAKVDAAVGVAATRAREVYSGAWKVWHDPSPNWVNREPCGNPRIPWVVHLS